MSSAPKSIFITGAGSGMGREGAKLFHTISAEMVRERILKSLPALIER